MGFGTIYGARSALSRPKAAVADQTPPEAQPEKEGRVFQLRNNGFIHRKSDLISYTNNFIIFEMTI